MEKKELNEFGEEVTLTEEIYIRKNPEKYKELQETHYKVYVDKNNTKFYKFWRFIDKGTGFSYTN